MKNRIEQVILENLIKDDEFVRKTIPFLKPEYFMAFEDNKVCLLYTSDAADE